MTRAPSPILADARALATAAAALRSGNGLKRATAEIAFDGLPRDHGYALVAGVEEAMLALTGEAPAESELYALRMSGVGSEPLAERLSRGALDIDVDSARTGTVVFPGEPVATIEGPLADVLIAASVISTYVGRGTAIATRASRYVRAAGGAVVIDCTDLIGDQTYVDLVCRAAHVGGAAATANVLAGARLGIPVRGVPWEWLPDLAPPERVDAAGWGEESVERILDLGACADEIDVALHRGTTQRGGTYAIYDVDRGPMSPLRVDIVAIERGGAWMARASGAQRRTGLAGRKLVARYLDDSGKPIADVLHLTSERIQQASNAILLGAHGALTPLPISAARSVQVGVTMLRGGRRLGAADGLPELRQRAAETLAKLPASIIALRSPGVFPVGVSPHLLATQAASSVQASAGSRGPVNGALLSGRHAQVFQHGTGGGFWHHHCYALCRSCREGAVSMRRALPIFSVLAVSAFVLGVPAVAHAECPPGSWFCADVAVPGPNGAAAPSPTEAPKAAAAPAPTATAGGGTTVIVNNAAKPAPVTTDIDDEAPPPKPKPKKRRPPPVYTYQPPPPAPPVYASRPHELWGLNTHIEGALIGGQKGRSDDSGMAGIGFALRSRPLRHLAFDFGIDFIGGKDYLGQRRSEVPFTIDALVFVNPKSAVQAYFLAGLGWSSAHVDLAQGGTAHYDYFGGRLGFGLEFRVTHRLSINTDIIGFVRGRTDDSANTQPEFTDPGTGRTTNTSGGGLFRGGLTFYWP